MKWAWSSAASAFLLLVTGVSVLAADLPPYYAEVSFPSQMTPWTAEASADFGALLRKLGEKAELDPASVRAIAEDGKPLPTRFEPDRGAKDRGLVRWNVPAAQAGTAQKFRICFAPLSSGRWEPVEPDAVGSANLLPNAGFELPEETGKKAKFWSRMTETGSRVADAKLAHTGQGVIKLLPMVPPGQTASQANIQTPGDPGVVVEGGKSYVFRYWSRVEGGLAGLSIAAQVYWYDAEKKYVSHDGIGSTFGADYAWQETSKVFQAPPNARYAMFYPMFYSTRGIAWLDDFGIWLTQPPQLASVQSQDGSRKAVLTDAGMNVKRLDFQPEGAPVWPGFAAVTPLTGYTRERSFGWLDGVQPQAALRDLPDDLGRSVIVPVNASRFRVDLPDGDYRAWFLIGDSGLGETIIPTYVDWSIRCGDRELIRYHPDARTWYEQVVFRNMNDWWTPEADMYARFIAPQYAEQTASFTATGGAAVFEFVRVPLGAMIIFPAGAEPAMKEELDRLRADRRRSTTVRCNAPVAETPAGVEEADRRRGFALFARDLSAAVLPTSAPQPNERLTGLRAEAAPGQYVPLSFALYPMKDLGEVTVSVSDLSAGAARIPSAAIEVAVVRYVERVADPKSYTYTVEPGPIQARNPLPTPKGVTVRWWLRLATPPDAAPGEYAGRIRIAPAQAEAVELPLTVRVNSIQLGPTPITAGLYHFDRTYWYIYWWRGCFGQDPWLRETTLQHEANDFQLLKEFGLNSLSFCDDNRGMSWDGQSWTFPKDDRFAVWMDLYKRAGMGPMPWYGFAGLGHPYLEDGLYTGGRKLELFGPEWQRSYGALIAAVKRMQVERGWPEVLFYLSDELSNEREAGAEIGRRLVQQVKDIPGIRTLASMNGPFEKVMLPGLKIAMPNHAFPITADSLAEVRKNQCELWVYNTGNSRVMWGFYLWRVGATGRFQWYHRYIYGEPWNAFDGDNPYSVTWLTPGKPLPSPDLWAIRAGIDDLRYVKALENAITRAGASGKAEAKAAAAEGQKTLDALRELVPEDARLLLGIIDPREAGRPAAGRLSEWRFLDEQRQAVVSCIMKIDAALR